MPQNNCYFIRNMLDTMLNPICYKDRNGIYVRVNRTFARQIVGLPEEEIIGYTLPEVASKIVEKFPERTFVNETLLLEHVAEWNTDDTELLNRGGASTHEYEGICADGIKRTFLVNKSTFDNEEGEIAGLVTVLQDITELDEVEKKLKKDEERYRVVTTQTGQIVFDYDITNKKISWSGATRKLMGFDSKKTLKVQVSMYG